MCKKRMLDAWREEGRGTRNTRHVDTAGDDELHWRAKNSARMSALPVVSLTLMIVHVLADERCMVGEGRVYWTNPGKTFGL